MAKWHISVEVLSSQTTSERTCSAEYTAVWVSSGYCRAQEITITAGEGHLFKKGETLRFDKVVNSSCICFELSKRPPQGDCALSSNIALPMQNENSQYVLRLDQVDFPAGAIAYRHVHPGDGIRFLVNGELTIISDTHVSSVNSGDAWFEAANSPVRAEATTEGPSSFVRFMVLPADCLGQPTIRILNSEDAKMPRLQSTKRHVDELAYLLPG